MQGSSHFAAGTLVTTARGGVPIEDVVVGDMVLTHLGHWRPVTGLLTRDGAVVVGLSTPAMSEATLVSREQLFWRSRDETAGWMDVGSLDKRDYLARVFPKEGLPVPWEDHPVVGAWTAEPDFWYVVGLYLGDGHARVGTSGKNARVEIRRPEGEHHVLLSVLDRLGLSCECRSSRGTFKVVVPSREFANVCLAFGDRPHERNVPGWVYSLSRWHRTRMVDGWMLSSGSSINGRRVCISCSKPFAIEMARLMEMTTGVPSCVYLNRSTRELAKGGYRHRYQVHHVKSNSSDRRCDSETAWFRAKAVEEVEGLQTVFGLDVEEDGSYHANGYAVRS